MPPSHLLKYKIIKVQVCKCKVNYFVIVPPFVLKYSTFPNTKHSANFMRLFSVLKIGYFTTELMPTTLGTFSSKPRSKHNKNNWLSSTQLATSSLRSITPLMAPMTPTLGDRVSSYWAHTPSQVGISCYSMQCIFHSGYACISFILTLRSSSLTQCVLFWKFMGFGYA